MHNPILYSMTTNCAHCLTPCSIQSETTSVQEEMELKGPVDTDTKSRHEESVRLTRVP